MKGVNHGWYLLGGVLGVILAGGPSESAAVLLAGAAICFEVRKRQPTQPQEPAP